MGALNFNWLGKLGTRRLAAEAAIAPLIPSRDLPLPRSPEAIPDEALVFAQSAARRVPESDDGFDADFAPAASIANGADLRAMLERFERAHRRRQVRDQATQARTLLVERLAAGRAAPTLYVVGGSNARAQAEDARRIDQAMEEALTSALTTLKRLSLQPKN